MSWTVTLTIYTNRADEVARAAEVMARAGAGLALEVGSSMVVSVNDIDEEDEEAE